MILRSGWQKNIVDSLYGIRNKPRQCCIMAKTKLRVTRPASPEIHGDKTFIPLEVKREVSLKKDQKVTCDGFHRNQKRKEGGGRFGQ